MDPKISVIIPAYNEELSIGLVLKDLPQEKLHEIIVVDNRSTDRTAEVASENGARVIAEPIRGYGSACLRGISALSDPDIVVFLDGDYSDYPEEINLLIDNQISSYYRVLSKFNDEINSQFSLDIRDIIKNNIDLVYICTLADSHVEIAEELINLGYMKDIIIEKPLKLDCGQTINNYPLAYETYGKLNERKDNAILIIL